MRARSFGQLGSLLAAMLVLGVVSCFVASSQSGTSRYAAATRVLLPRVAPTTGGPDTTPSASTTTATASSDRHVPVTAYSLIGGLPVVAPSAVSDVPAARALRPMRHAAYVYDSSQQTPAAIHETASQVSPRAVDIGVAAELAASQVKREIAGALDAGLAAEDGTTLFRGMRGAADGSPELGSTAKSLGARPGIDIPVDEGGMVRPGTGGMSVNDSPTGMPEYRRPPSFGGSGKDLNMYCISSCDIGPGLRYVPDAGGHGFLEPAWPMPFSEYQGYLQGTAGSWAQVLP